MRKYLFILLLLPLALAFGGTAHAQFRSEAFSQSYNDDPASPKDSTDTMFSFREFFGGLAHKNPLKIGTMTAGSAVFIGAGQIYNRDYWKLPFVYGGIAGGATAGFILRKEHPTAAKYCFAAAGVAYWATLMDEVMCYESDQHPLAGRATLYSLLVPGLGQIYNGETWKLPIYWGGLMGSVHFYSLNRTQYKRFRRIYREATDTANPYTGPISAQTALYYRNLYRRYRDYSILAIASFYLLQVIDANVFSYMHDFNIADDLSLSIDPAVITPGNAIAMAPGDSAFGVRFGFTF
ncbi:MAG: hypothetical protein IJ222_10460 [Bacteroidales bacterium]|nr:hypothetical protein [Bacteroidales bacterium]